MRFDKIKQLREEQRLSQEKLAQRAGVSRVTIANLENGFKHPDTKTLMKVATALGVPIFEIWPSSVSVEEVDV